MPYSFSSEKNLHPFLSSGPFGTALWFATACASLQSWLHFSHQSLCSFCVNYWSVLDIWSSKEMGRMVQTTESSLRARSVVWLRQCLCQIQQKKSLGDKSCLPLDLWHAQHGSWCQLKKECDTKSLQGAQGLDMTPASVRFGWS